jgi:hypothetical protein
MIYEEKIFTPITNQDDDDEGEKEEAEEELEETD